MAYHTTFLAGFVSAILVFIIGRAVKAKVEAAKWRKKHIYNELYNEVNDILNLEHPEMVTRLNGPVWDEIEDSKKIRVSENLANKADYYSTLINQVDEYWSNPDLHSAEILEEKGFFQPFEEEFADLIESSLNHHSPGPSIIFERNESNMDDGQGIPIVVDDDVDVSGYHNDKKAPTIQTVSEPLYMFLFDIRDIVRESTSPQKFREELEDQSDHDLSYWDEVYQDWEDKMWGLLQELGQNVDEYDGEPGLLPVTRNAGLLAKQKMITNYKLLQGISNELKGITEPLLKKSPYNPVTWFK